MSKLKISSPTRGAGLDLIFFIVQLGATGPPKYTLSFAKLVIFYGLNKFSGVLLVRINIFFENQAGPFPPDSYYGTIPVSVSMVWRMEGVFA